MRPATASVHGYSHKPDHEEAAEGTGILCRCDNRKKIYQSQIIYPLRICHRPGDPDDCQENQCWGTPLGLAIAPDQKHLYIANVESNELEEIDTETDSVVARIPT